MHCDQSCLNNWHILLEKFKLQDLFVTYTDYTESITQWNVSKYQKIVFLGIWNILEEFTGLLYKCLGLGII